MIFTRHAIERYRQFHMLDQPTATDEDARQILERFGPTATRVNAKTYRGDPVWCIESLGVELVAKNEDGTVVCVTILPPMRFRGLTPLQAEAVENSAREAKERAALVERELTEAQAALSVHDLKVKMETRVVAANRQAEATRTRAVLKEQIRKAKHAAAPLLADRDILLSTLKTMRQQLAQERDADKYKAALRIAVRYLLDAGSTDALAAIAAVDPGLASEAFANGVRAP